MRVDDRSSPAALRQPVATIECRIWACRTASRRVIAVSATDAAEWEMYGGRVRWRQLFDREVLSAVSTLIPAWSSSGGGPPIPLGDLCVARVITEPPSAEELEAVPAELRSLFSAPDLAWVTLVVASAAQAGLRRTTLRLAFSARDGVWQFRRSATGETAERITAERLRSEVLRLLRASDSVDSVRP